MPNDPLLAADIVALLATYGLHSSLLLGAVWLAVTVGRLTSPALLERLWRLAALAPLVTAPLQFAGAQQLGNWSVWTLPAISFQPQSASREESIPTIARGSATVASSQSSQQSQTGEVPAADNSAGEMPIVDIAPGPTLSATDLPLPVIEPGPVGQLDATPTVNDATSAPTITAAPTIRSETSQPLESPPASIASLPVHQHSESSVRPEAVVRAHVDWRAAAAAVFGCLMAAGLMRIGWRGVVARRRLRQTETITDGQLRHALDRLLRERNVRKSVRLAYSATANEPAAGGIVRWVIVVPPGVEDRLTPAEQQALLAHELAHLVRRDPLWLWIGATLCCCLPVQPLNFLAVRRWRQAAEELCDDWAIAGGVRPLTLANCLTRVAEWRLSPMPVGLTADIGKSRFARRIARLIDGTRPNDRWSSPANRRALLSGALGCIALLVCCGPRMQAAHREEARSPAPATVTPAESPVPEPVPRARANAESSPPAEPNEPTDVVPDAELQSELTALLDDLARIESIAASLGDDPEINAVRTRLRDRLTSLRARLPIKPLPTE